MSTATTQTETEITAASGLRILIADKFEAKGVSDLEAAGNTVTLDPALTPDTLPEAIGAADGRSVERTSHLVEAQGPIVA